MKTNIGALVSDIEQNSPAVSGGLKSGDVVIEYDGKDIMDRFHLMNLVTNTEINKEVEMAVIRKGKELKLKAIITERPKDNTSEKKSILEKLGLLVQTLTRKLAFKFGYEDEKGVIITNVHIGSPSHKADLNVGDLKLEVHHKPIANTDEFFQAIKGNKNGGDILLFVKHQKGTSSYVVLKTCKEE